MLGDLSGLRRVIIHCLSCGVYGLSEPNEAFWATEVFGEVDRSETNSRFAVSPEANRDPSPWRLLVVAFGTGSAVVTTDGCLFGFHGLGLYYCPALCGAKVVSLNRDLSMRTADAADYRGW